MKLTVSEEQQLHDILTNILVNGNIETADDILSVFKDYLTNHKPTVLQWIEKMFSYAEKKEWFETYWAIDLHGTVSRPDYRKESKEIDYYPYAKETLQLMTERSDIKLIMFTSSYPDEIKKYYKQFRNDGIIFDFINENPEVSDAKGSFGYYDKKPYFNVLLEDKAGFNPGIVWEYLYNYFKNTEYRPNKEWSMKYNEKYHK